jgi:hypothetical protein
MAVNYVLENAWPWPLWKELVSGSEREYDIYRKEMPTLNISI